MHRADLSLNRGTNLGEATPWAADESFDRVATFFDLHFLSLFPDLREFSLTSSYSILEETEIIKLNLR